MFTISFLQLKHLKNTKYFARFHNEGYKQKRGFLNSFCRCFYASIFYGCNRLVTCLLPNIKKFTMNKKQHLNFFSFAKDSLGDFTHFGFFNSIVKAKSTYKLIKFEFLSH